MKRPSNRRAAVLGAVAAVALALLAGAAPAVSAGGPAGAVYTLTNSASWNAVVVYNRAGDGRIRPLGTFATGGLGTGSGLGSQGALVLSDNGRSLYAVNAGSSEITAFSVQRGGLTRVSKVDSRGSRPISVTAAGKLVYVLNQGEGDGAGNIAGFMVRPNGRLAPLPGSVRPLSAASVGPAQIQFSPDGRLLVVTEKATNLIDTYVVGSDGIARGPNVEPSAGETPFGFDFDRRGHLIVSDAFGGAPGASAMSSYELDREGNVTPITPLAPNGQTAACWVVITKDGRFAYVTNTGSANVSSYAVARDGSIAVLDPAAGATGAGPIDAALSTNSRYLYTLDSGPGAISAFAVAPDGALSPIEGAGGLPEGAVGLAAQ